MRSVAPIHVIGASGRSGRALCRALHARGDTVIAVTRRPVSDEAFNETRQAELEDPAALKKALADAKRVVSTAHARYIPAILEATSADTVLIGLGSTRKFTNWPDAHGRGVLAGETALLKSGRPGLLLHPTMIYGARGEDNVQRLAALLRRLPLVPLPNGGRARVQPIYQDDVTRALVAALDLAASGAIAGPETLVIAGPDPVAYRDFIRAILHASAMRQRPIVSIPGRLLEYLAPLVSRLPGFPEIGRDEVRRLMEDKAFDSAPMRARLGFDPVSLQNGLRQLFDADDRVAARNIAPAD
ncbi:NAD(P)H-binding protein [Swaminathania salitolerans]|uniref:NAD(P)-binding domain-containing protein n=1 Tax=Swaminathania salitolerans TaxID=182838 RepID=A0A511BR28_9PROT|nr:NAD-dependent epimerase/dehydratase family protein [Swaminathania salitolerans]GBQ11580.1 NADH-ubiquinone oxidoreductase 39-40 kDa subunit [Swaminathania salitolerans LMG 21291]GEL02542.1 hypothetical protein SSA02_17050 [Swaminathania salitolerans]